MRNPARAGNCFAVLPVPGPHARRTTAPGLTWPAIAGQDISGGPKSDRPRPSATWRITAISGCSVWLDTYVNVARRLTNIRGYILGELAASACHVRMCASRWARVYTRDLAPRIDGVVAALDFEQALGFAGSCVGGTDQVGRAYDVILGEDHEQRTRRDQFDRPGGRVLKDRLKRTHGDLVAPRWRDCCLCLLREIPAFLIGLQRETLAGLSNVEDVRLAALGRVP